MATTNLIEEIIVDSSCISWAKHYKYSKKLKLEYANGNKYEYNGISNELWSGLYNAESKGEFINKNIKPNYKCKKVIC